MKDMKQAVKEALAELPHNIGVGVLIGAGILVLWTAMIGWSTTLCQWWLKLVG